MSRVGLHTNLHIEINAVTYFKIWRPGPIRFAAPHIKENNKQDILNNKKAAQKYNQICTKCSNEVRQ